MSEVPGQNYEEIQKPVEQPTGVLESQETLESLIPQEVQEKIEKAGWNDGMGNQTEEYKKFSDYITNLSSEDRENIFQMILGANGRKLKKYIQENGYILGQTSQDFKKEFYQEKNSEDILIENTEVKTENKEVKTENKEVKTENKEVKTENTETALETQKKISDFVNIFQSKISSFHDTELESYLQQAISLFSEGKNLDLSDINNSKVLDFQNKGIKLTEQIKQHLSQNGNLQKISDTFKKNNDEAGYEAFKSYAISLDPSFQAEFQKYDEGYGKRLEDAQKSELKQAQVVGAMGTEDFQKYGNIIEATNAGQTTLMDIGEVPPRRYVGLEGSNYSLETDVPVGDFYNAVSHEGLAYEKTAKENGDTIVYLQRLGSLEVQNFLSGDEFEKESLQNCIRIISSLIGLSGDIKLEDICDKAFSSKQDLKEFVTSSGFLTQKDKLKKEIDEKKQAYQKALKARMSQYKKMMESKDAETKQVLEVLRSLGLDNLGSSLDLIIAQIQAGMIQLDLGGRTFDKQHIDLANGDFGESRTQDNSMNLRRNLVAFANKMYFGNIEGKDTAGNTVGFDVSLYTRSEGSVPQTKTPGEIQKILNDPENGIIGAAGITDMNKIKQRLESKEVQ